MNAADTGNLAPYGNGTLPAGIRSRTVDNNNGLKVHVLEAGFETRAGPCVLLLHGFPELAYSWRKVMLPLAAAGYHVIAPDQRGYGRTTGWDDDYDADGDPFRNVNMVRDAMGLVYALGLPLGGRRRRPRRGLAGRVVVRGDPARRFRKLALMSSPFPGPPKIELQHRQRRGAGAAAATPTTNSTPNSPSSSRRASTIATTSARAAPTTTCCTRRRACTTSSAPTTTPRAPTGKATRRIR